MIFYKPIVDIDVISKEFSLELIEIDCVYGMYFAINEDSETVGKCLVKVNKYNCYILELECDYSDKLLIEGFVRASLNFSANRNAYFANCSLTKICDVLEFLGFEYKNGTYSGDIPTLLKGSCCK